MAAPPQLVGQILGHYRILEQIGAGGMGVVYRAHDEQLDRDVALKVLPARMLANESARRHFRREALALAKLSHPNIGAVYEFGSQEGLDFLVMELVTGVTLEAKLAGGPLSESEVFCLGTQLADGLEAAHVQGVVHRDVKPGNLRLTKEGRLKILDFGLAQWTPPQGDEPAETITKAQEVQGTLPYMAPEQLRGEKADARTDIYAAGAVLYEMVTGKRPYRERSGPQLVGAILLRAPLPPSAHNHRVSPALESMILKALDKDPSRRYQSARELRVDLERLSGSLMSVVPRRRHWVLAVTALVIVIVLLVDFSNVLHVHEWLRSRTRSKVTGATRNLRRSVAVLGFKNLSSRPDEVWLSTAISEMLTTDLAAGEKLRTVPGEDVTRMKINLALPDTDSYGKVTLSKIRQNVGADDVIVGSYLALGNGLLRLDLRLEDASTGEIVDAVSETGREADVADLVSRTGAHLRQRLGVSDVSPVEAMAVKASLPSNPDAARLYSEGLVKLRQFENLVARDLLEKAIAAEANFSLAHAALADALSGLGYDAKAREEAEKAFDLSGPLSREQRLWVEGRYREATHEWDKAIDTYRALFEFFPDNLEYGLRLARVQTSASRGREALATLGRLRKLPAPVSDDPRIDQAEAEAAGSIGDFKRDEASSARAAEKGQALGARLLVARARHYQCWALHKLGQQQQAQISCEQAKRMFTEAGDQDSVASLLVTAGAVLEEQGELAAAQSMYEQALVTYRNTGDQGGAAVALNNLAVAHRTGGNYPAAKKMYQESLSISREIGDEDGVVLAQGNLADLAFNEGDLRRAHDMFQELLVVCREIGTKDRIALQAHNLGETLYFQGDLSGAERALEEARVLDSQSGEKTQLAYHLASLGNIFQAEAKLPEARQKRLEALKLREELGDKGDAADTRVALAESSIEEGRAGEAEAPLRQAIAELKELRLIDDEAASYTLLARALLSAGKPAEAAKVTDSGSPVVAQSRNRSVHLAFAIVAARVDAATGEHAQAAASLNRTLAEATKYGFAGYAFDARLAMGEIEMKSGQGASGRVRLASLEKDATAKGFLLIARKAAAARKRNYVVRPTS